MNTKRLLLVAAAISVLPLSTACGQAPATRTEHDLLGDKQIPADAYYGVQTARALENFQISGTLINQYPGFVEAWAIVKLAAARANTQVGAMKPDRLAAIEKAYEAIMAGQYHEHFLVDWFQGGAGTSTNMNANEVMANIALELTNRNVEAVGQRDLAAPEPALELVVMVAGHGQRQPRLHHGHGDAQRIRRVGSPIDEIAHEDRPPAGRSRDVGAPLRTPAAERDGIAEAPQQLADLVGAAVHIADDIERPG